MEGRAVWSDHQMDTPVCHPHRCLWLLAKDPSPSCPAFSGAPGLLLCFSLKPMGGLVWGEGGRVPQSHRHLSTLTSLLLLQPPPSTPQCPSFYP